MIYHFFLNNKNVDRKPEKYAYKSATMNIIDKKLNFVTENSCIYRCEIQQREIWLSILWRHHDWVLRRNGFLGEVKDQRGFSNLICIVSYYRLFLQPFRLRWKSMVKSKFMMKE